MDTSLTGAGEPGVELNVERCDALIRRAIAVFDLDLTGLTVLTEAATGAFAMTPLIAARAGAEKVWALTRDSRHGSSQRVAALTGALAEEWGVESRIEVVTSRHRVDLEGSDVVTNLGFVRPLDRDLLQRLGPGAAIALMFEPWEHRDGDLDLGACRELGIPVLGTNEDDPRLRTFDYLPVLAAKLLLELDIEVHGSRLILISGGKFASAINEGLTGMGATLHTFAPPVPMDDASVGTGISEADAIIVADHPPSGPIIAAGEPCSAAELLRRNPALSLVHISGDVDARDIDGAGLPHAPERIAAPGTMSVTAGYLGPKPVIDLHSAGLTVGAALSRARRGGLEGIEAEASVVRTLPLALGFSRDSATIT